MSKLVLVLPDGTTLDVPLKRERTTIGRRADNDICLPHLAVSGEHAVVVTILADSFLEDLNSTNGTLVNEKPIAKHFLRDRDEIEIGRHKLVYCVDDDAKLESQVREGAARIAERDFGGRVEPAKPFAGKQGKPAPPPAAQAAAIEPLIPDPVHGTAEEAVPAPAAPPIPPAPPRGPSVKLLSGLKAGAHVALTKPETTLGRPGIQVASIVRSGASFKLKPMEGISPPTVNGQPVGPDGAELASGDVIEIAGTRVEFVDPRQQAAKQDEAAGYPLGSEARCGPAP
ncbi:MAG TPA: FHA domain-containing protein [Casimicrobiaceae bacterium]